jgi:hypothetical protein
MHHEAASSHLQFRRATTRPQPGQLRRHVAGVHYCAAASATCLSVVAVAPLQGVVSLLLLAVVRLLVLAARRHTHWHAAARTTPVLCMRAVHSGTHCCCPSSSTGSTASTVPRASATSPLQHRRVAHVQHLNGGKMVKLPGGATAARAVHSCGRCCMVHSMREGTGCAVCELTRQDAQLQPEE